jgi:hypothetical protein
MSRIAGYAPPYISRYNKLPAPPHIAKRYMTQLYKKSLSAGKTEYTRRKTASAAPAAAAPAAAAPAAPAAAAPAAAAAVPTAPHKKQKTHKHSDARAATPPPRSPPHVPLSPRAATPPPTALRATAQEFKSMLTPNATPSATPSATLKKGGKRRKHTHKKHRK